MTDTNDLKMPEHPRFSLLCGKIAFSCADGWVRVIEDLDKYERESCAAIAFQHFTEKAFDLKGEDYPDELEARVKLCARVNEAEIAAWDWAAWGRGE